MTTYDRFSGVTEGTSKLNELPELPEPANAAESDDCTYACPEGFTAEQMEAYARAAVQAERERLAALVSSGDFCRYADHVTGACDCREMAAAIRSMKDSPP